MCDTIYEQIAKTDDFAKRVSLSEMVVDCETRNYPAVLEGDIFTGVRESDPWPVVKPDNRPMSERAAEVVGEGGALTLCARRCLGHR